jgi:hypothetical protein
LTAGASGLAVTAGAVVVPNAATSAEPEDRPGRWSVIVSPYIWAASLKGDASLAGFDTAVDVPFSDIVEHLDLALMGNVELTDGRFGVYVDGQHVNTSQHEQVLGQDVGLKAKTTSVSVGAFLRLYDVDLGGSTVFGQPRRFGIEPTAGVRWTRLEADVQALGQAVDKSADWSDPFVGVRLAADLSARWNLAAEGDLGGFDGSNHSVNAQAYLGYRTPMLGRPSLVRVGYRYLSLDYETTDFTGGRFRWDVVQQGPALGVSIRF